MHGEYVVDKHGNLRPLDFALWVVLVKKPIICRYIILFNESKYEELAEVHFKAGYVPSTYGFKQFANELETWINQFAGKVIYQTFQWAVLTNFLK